MTKPIYTFDTETDPFIYGREPRVFLCGIYDGETLRYKWGDNCMLEMRELISALPPGIVYVHNGGRFDFYHMLGWFDGKISITNSRIIRAYGCGHEWRDSAAIYPMPLKSYKKGDIDYNKMEASERDKYRDEILDYFEKDCRYLHELVTRFLNEFGDNITIGGTSMKQLKKLHEFKTLDEMQDRMIRERFYFGGRVQCFEKGIITPKETEYLKCYDINQSYPASMRNYRHPIGTPDIRNGEPDNNTFFVTVYGRSFGCFPKRTNDGGLHFPIGVDTFNVSIYEYRAALDTGQFESYSVLECVDFEESGTFDEFVDEFHCRRKQCQLDGDKLGSDFNKLVCNSAYGKFAQSPDNYFDYIIKPLGVDVPDFDPEYIIGNVVLWRKPSEDSTRYNVATGASITGCSRSFLIRALASCKRPLYCDTDSIICEAIGNDIEIDSYKIGAWKLEKHGNMVAIAGRKLYALWNGGECVKYASKGVRLSPEQIVEVASGNKVTWKKDAPTYSLSGQVRFMHRDVVMT